MYYNALLKLSLVVLGLILTLLAGVEVYLIGIAVISSFSGGPQSSFEWGSLVGLLVFFALIYFSIFTFWAYTLKRKSFQKLSVKVQLLIIVISSVLPAIIIVTDTLLRRVFLIEQPITENLLKGLVYFVLLPFE